MKIWTETYQNRHSLCVLGTDRSEATSIMKLTTFMLQHHFEAVQDDDPSQSTIRLLPVQK